MVNDSLNKNKVNNLIAVLAVVVVVVALANLYVTFSKVSDFEKEVTGFATGYVNLTVFTKLEMNVTNGSINFGEGSISAGELNATLQTNGVSAATISRGNWTTETSGMIIENIGTINFSLKLQTVFDATDFFGEVGQEQYQWNLSNYEVNSCGDWDEISAQNIFTDVNKTAQATICNKLDFASASNSMLLDVLLTVPYNTTNTSIVLQDTITLTADTAV